MPRDEVFIHSDLLERAPKRGRQRDEVMRFIHSLRADPHTSGDFTEMDASFRKMQIKIVGDFAIPIGATIP